MNKYPRGSEWLKWDLHIHSNASDGKGSPEQIMEEAKRKGLDVIAITDHHTAKNIDELKQLSVNYNITIISGVEFKTDSGNDSVHLIGLFPDIYNGSVLNSKAIHDLILAPLGFSETEIIRKGRMKEHQADDVRAFKLGMHDVHSDFEIIAKKIHEYGGLVIVHAGRKSNSIEQMKHVGEREDNAKDLYSSLGVKKEELFTKGYIDICEIKPNESDKEFYLKKFGRASIYASDAHSIEQIGERFTWIKANPTFEGLKQIVYEPQDRVLLKDSSPQAKPDYQIIDSITIKHDDFQEMDLLFNQNLNVIIGGKSSGKSLLLGIIAKKINGELKIKRDFQNYDTYINDLVEHTIIKWMDNEADINRDIEYFPQSYINGLVAIEDNTKNLIEGIIKADISKKDIIDEFNRLCIEVKSEINKEIENLFIIKNKLSQLIIEIKNKGSKSGIEKEISKIKLKIEKINNTLNKNISDEDLSNYDEYNRSIKENSIKYEKLENIIYTLEKIKNKDMVISLNSLYLDDEVMVQLESIYNSLQRKVNMEWFTSIDLLIMENKKKIYILKETINKTKNDPLFLKCLNYFHSNETYIELDKALKMEEEKKLEIDNSEQSLNHLREKLKESQKQLLKSHRKYYDYANGLIEKLEIEKDEIKISPRIKFDDNYFNNLLSERFNQKYRESQDILQFKFENYEKYNAFLESNIISKILEEKAYLKNNINSQQVLIDILCNNHFGIYYDIIYQNDSLSLMSEGKKAYIILRLLLDHNNKQCPILIDQPEDDLDNRSISNELVNYIKKTKKNRQIIVITHNPNIVIGADAEEVIVANQNGISNPNRNSKKFSYISGAIENTFIKKDIDFILEAKGIKEHICEILEGGDEAFMKREKKYGFHDIK